MAKKVRQHEIAEVSSLADLAQQVASLRDQLHEVKELVCTLITHHGCARYSDPPSPKLFSRREVRITLEEAVPMVWGKSAAKDPESLRIHTSFLKHWARVGINAAVLETDVVDGVWYTSQEAVERFQEKMG